MYAAKASSTNTRVSHRSGVLFSIMIKKKGARLGQHFLTAHWAAVMLAREAGIRPDDTVVEIGPGKGALTGELLKLSHKVLAIEKDTQLIQTLHETLASDIATGSLRVLDRDIRDFDPAREDLTSGSYVVAANIPYYITGEIIRQFLSCTTPPHSMTLLIQKEVAQRIVAQDRKESILSISVKAYGTPRIVAKVGKGCFNPPPSVDSAIIGISAISKDFFANISEEAFFRVVRAGFASKRKYLANNLAVLYEKEAVKKALEALALSDKVRAEDIGISQWKALTQTLE